jgi:Flp pilus assembly protein TadD
LLARTLGSLKASGYPRITEPEGEPYARRAVELRARLLGTDHPQAAADSAALASILAALGKYDEAERRYRHALAVFERVHGPEHDEIAVNLSNLASLLLARGETLEAERLFRRSLASLAFLA